MCQSWSYGAAFVGSGGFIRIKYFSGSQADIDDVLLEVKRKNRVIKRKKREESCCSPCSRGIQ